MNKDFFRKACYGPDLRLRLVKSIAQPLSNTLCGQNVSFTEPKGQKSDVRQID